ncbi:MAG: cation:proton antiporter, partial [Pseudomonadota bacterium]
MASRKHLRLVGFVGIALACCASAPPGDGADPAKIMLALAIILMAAKLVGDLFVRIGQPTVLGELLAGIILGNLPLLGVHELGFVVDGETIRVLAEVGVVLLLFEVGLESDVGKMLRVGASSMLVAVVGVVVPMTLGYLVARAMIPQLTWHAHVFIGAILTATSVGITARVLKDVGRIQSTEGRIILGAAVIDDVLGLIVLAVVQGIVTSAADPGQQMGVGGVLWIIAKAAIFLGGAVILGGPISRRLFRAATYLQIHGMLLAIALAFCFLLAFLAHLVDLAPIVGAFAAGLILNE